MCGPEMPLVELAARHGFYTRPLSYLRRLAEYLEVHDALSLPLVQTVLGVATQVIPKCTDADKQAALVRREVCYDTGAEDLARVLQFECVLELFNDADKSQLQSEITAAKEKKAEREYYQTAVKAYKAACA